MPSFLSVYDSKGKCVGRCNSRCYNAKLPSHLHKKTTRHRICVCICGGANHAAGEVKAMKNYLAGIGRRPEDLTAFAKLKGLNPKKLVVIDRLKRTQYMAQKTAVAHFKPKRLPLFAYGRLADRREPNTESLPVGAQQRRQ